MNLVPIPRENVEGSLPVWLPFLRKIADHSGYRAEQLMERIATGEVLPIVIWDDETKQARGFAGARVFMRGDDRIAEVIWLTGFDKDAWTHLIGDFEDYAKHIGCVGVRMFARRGWKPFLVERGYRETHTILDKDWK